MNCIDWNKLDRCFSGIDCSADPPCSHSPALAIDYRVYLLVLECMLLGRQRTKVVALKSGVARTKEKLMEIEKSQDEYYGLEHGMEVRRARYGSQCFISALKILLAKIDPTCADTAAEIIQSLVTEIQVILEETVASVVETSLLWWPLAVVMCAITKQDDLQGYIDRSQRFHFDGGSTRRWRILLDIITRRQREKDNENLIEGQNTSDNLDVFMLTDGLVNLMVSDPFLSLASTTPGPQSFWLWQGGKLGRSKPFCSS